MAERKGAGMAIDLRIILAAAVGAAVAGVCALYGWAGVGWLLLLLAVVMLIAAAYRLWSDPARSKELRRWVSELDPVRVQFLSGGVLLAAGLLARFGPYDVAIGLAIAGFVLLAAGIASALQSTTTLPRPGPAGLIGDGLPGVPGLSVPGLSVDAAAPASDRSTAEFRAQVVQVIMRQAQRASRIYLALGILLIVMALGLFALLCYLAFRYTGSNELSEVAAAYWKQDDRVPRGVQVEENRALVVGMFVGVMAPLFSWALLGVFGIFLIVLGIRLLQRRVVQDALSELGPLQAVLAGIPPRKPFLQVTDQSLSQAQRSFSTRLMLSVVLFWVGIALVLITVIYGLLSGMQSQPAWLTTGVLGGGSILSFIFGAVLNQQGAQRAMLEEITSRELILSRYAQRAELVDALLAVLSRSPPEKWDLKLIRDILAFDEPHTEPPGGTKKPPGAEGGSSTV